jgi:predicted RNase H-like nuclease (RuvC/YqgF family)
MSSEQDKKIEDAFVIMAKTTTRIKNLETKIPKNLQVRITRLETKINKLESRFNDEIRENRIDNYNHRHRIHRLEKQLTWAIWLTAATTWIGAIQIWTDIFQK